MFSDEADFWLNGYFNKQIWQKWAENQPEEVQELSLHPEKTTVWCGLWAGGIIGLYFFKNEAGRNVSVNGPQYRTMMTNYFLPEIEAHDLDDNNGRATMALLRENFEQLISRSGPVNWLLRSCDITPLDFFIWGYLKFKVYMDKPATMEESEANISYVIRNYHWKCWNALSKIGNLEWTM